MERFEAMSDKSFRISRMNEPDKRVGGHPEGKPHSCEETPKGRSSANETAPSIAHSNDRSEKPHRDVAD